MSIKNSIYIGLLVIVFAACQNKPNNSIDQNFTIKVSIEDIPNNTMVWLKKQENNIPITIDSTVTKNGTFELKGNVEVPSIYGIFIDSLEGGIFPIVEKGILTITAHKDSLFNAQITGSKLNEELDNFKAGSQKIVSKINELFPEFQKARTENDLEKIEELNAKMRGINDENTDYSLNYAKNNPDSHISAIVLNSLLRMPNLEKDSISIIYSNFSEEVKKSEFSKNISKYLEAVTSQTDSIN